MRFMRLVRSLAGSLLGLAGVAPQVLPAQDVPERHPVAFHRVTVVDVRDGRLVPDRTVVVEGNRITTIAPSGTIDIPLGATLVDAHGKYLIPGLWDMHVHLFNQVTQQPPNVWVFPLLIANGVTGVREMWTRAADVPTLTVWREQITAGTLLGPRIGAAGALVDGPASWWPTTDRVSTADDARRFVRDAHDTGRDFVKVYGGLSKSAYLAITSEARTAGVPVAGHIPLRVRATEAAAAGQRSNEHLQQIREGCSIADDLIMRERERHYARRFTIAQDDSLWNRHERLRSAGFDEARCRTVARRLAVAGMWQVPTLVSERRWFLGDAEVESDPRLAFIPAEERLLWREGLASFGIHTTEVATGRQRRRLPDEGARRWMSTLAVVGTLARAKVPFLAGTDLGTRYVFPGSSLHDELQFLVDAGLTPLEALRAATVNPARFLRTTDSLGTIEPGKIADLVLLDANPLADVRNVARIRGVMFDGRYFDRRRLDALLQWSERAANTSAGSTSPGTPARH